MFENKSELRDIKSHYAEYNDVYDDEYDDTYDDNDIGANDNDSADELTTRRPFTTPRILTVSAKDASGASESSEEEVKTKPLDMFIPNPAEVRARQEATRRSKYESRNKDILKGQPKGKGQSAQTERKRHDKDKHKASRANHNRKIMSDKKRSKAMI
ncbi:activating signal cointegrator 1 complex subunit 2-like [Saccoglossus kowalevskii]